VGDEGRKSLDSVENGSSEDRHLLKDGIGSENKSLIIVPLLKKFLVLVERFQLIKSGNIDIEVHLISLSDKVDFEVEKGGGC